MVAYKLLPVGQMEDLLLFGQTENWGMLLIGQMQAYGMFWFGQMEDFWMLLFRQMGGGSSSG